MPCYLKEFKFLYLSLNYLTLKLFWCHKYLNFAYVCMYVYVLYLLLASDIFPFKGRVHMSNIYSELTKMLLLSYLASSNNEENIRSADKTSVKVHYFYFLSLYC